MLRLATAVVPGLQQVDRQKNDERQHQHCTGQCRGPGIVEFVEADHDQQGRNFRNVLQVAGNEDDRTVLSDRARERKRRTRQQGGRTVGRMMWTTVWRRVAPSVAATSSSCFSASSSTGSSVRTTKGRLMNTIATMTPSGV